MSDLHPTRARCTVWNFGVGHSQFSWYLRTRPRLRAMFELIWGTSDLIASFEGFSWLPPRRFEASWRLGEAWLHTDQNGMSRPGLQTVQSFTSLYDQDETTGAFVVVPRSWQAHNAVTRRVYRATPSTSAQQQFLMIPPDDIILSSPQAPHLVRCRAGDSVLWDSRTVHCSTPGLETAPSPHTSARRRTSKAAVRPARVVAYCAMTPRARASSHVLMQRQRALFSRRTCTHWPYDMSCLPTPSEAGEVPSDPLPRAEPVHKELVGYTDEQLAKWRDADPLTRPLEGAPTSSNGRTTNHMGAPSSQSLHPAPAQGHARRLVGDDEDRAAQGFANGGAINIDGDSTRDSRGEKQREVLVEQEQRDPEQQCAV